MEQDTVIKVPYVCRCNKKMLVKKKPATQFCNVKCPQCGNTYRIKFDTTTDPQTYTFVEPQQPANNPTIYVGKSTRPAGEPGVKAQRKSEGTRIVKLEDLRPPGPETGNEKDETLLKPCNAWLVQLKLFHRTAERYQLRYGETTVGRFDVAEQSDIPINGDYAISRRSVSITITPMGSFTDYRLKVLKATNPVFVNGKKIDQGKHIMLNDGDKIRLGNTKFRFEVR